MSRNKKILILVGCLVVSLAVLGVVGYQISSVSAATSKGITAVTVWGWVQLALSGLASVGLSGATLWQIVAELLDTHAVQVADKLDPTGTNSSVRSAMKYVHIQRILADVNATPAGKARDLLVLSGREACDQMKDAMFPVKGTT